MKRQQSKRNHPRVRSVERTKSGFTVSRDEMTDVQVAHEEIRMTSKQTGKLLKKPVREVVMTTERRNGVVVRTVKRRKSARKLGVAV